MAALDAVAQTCLKSVDMYEFWKLCLHAFHTMVHQLAVTVEHWASTLSQCTADEP